MEPGWTLESLESDARYTGELMPGTANLPLRMSLSDIEETSPLAEGSFWRRQALDVASRSFSFPNVDSTGQDAPPVPPPPFNTPHGSWSGAGNHFSGDAWKKYVWDDYLTQPAVLIPVGLAVSAAAISHWDRRLQRHWFGALGNRGRYSDIGQDTLLGAVILLGVIVPGDGRNWWDEVWTIGEAYATSSLTTFALKTVVGRPRPGSPSGGGVGTHSFPSGHSTSAFTAATLIERNSGLWVGLPAYGLAAFTAFERVEEGRHYPSDILAGAAIGTLWASISDHLHWGSGPQPGGIARPPVDVRVGFVEGLHGFDLEVTLRF